jgi:hypothetical protein
MAAHAGSISIGTRKRRETRPHRLGGLGQRLRQRRLRRAERAYSMRTHGTGPRSIPGSEHAHVLRHEGP